MVAKRLKPTLLQQQNNNIPVPTLATPRSKLKADHLKKFSPLTHNQQRLFDSIHSEQHVIADGYPGTGKTWCSMYCAFKEVLIERNYSKIVIIRSIVPTRDIGFLKGTLEEKVAIYEQPYKDICSDLFLPGIQDPYTKCKEQGIIEFMPTSFIRGTTINDAIIIIDEAQNLEFSEASSVITRVGKNSKLILCGDYYQSDLQKKSEKDGYLNIKKILETMNDVDFIHFDTSDIVRSGFVKKFILAKIKLGFQD